MNPGSRTVGPQVRCAVHYAYRSERPAESCHEHNKICAAFPSLGTQTKEDHVSKLALKNWATCRILLIASLNLYCISKLRDMGQRRPCVWISPGVLRPCEGQTVYTLTQGLVNMRYRGRWLGTGKLSKKASAHGFGPLTLIQGRGRLKSSQTGTSHSPEDLPSLKDACLFVIRHNSQILLNLCQRDWEVLYFQRDILWHTPHCGW